MVGSPSLAGKSGLFEVSRRLNRPACRRTSHEARSMCYHDPESTQCGHTSRPSEWYRHSVDPESPTSGSAIISASRTSFQYLYRPKHRRSLHGHCRRGWYREVMGLSQLEGCPTVLEQSWGSCYLSVESTGMPRRSIRRCGERGYYLWLPVTCHYNSSNFARCIPRHQCILPIRRPLHLHYI